jgi:hypothetical protein
MTPIQKKRNQIDNGTSQAQESDTKATEGVSAIRAFEGDLGSVSCAVSDWGKWFPFEIVKGNYDGNSSEILHRRSNP